jgi:hypothetical protein
MLNSAEQVAFCQKNKHVVFQTLPVRNFETINRSSDTRDNKESLGGTRITERDTCGAVLRRFMPKLRRRYYEFETCLTTLRPMAQCVIHQHQREQRLDDGRGA